MWSLSRCFWTLNFECYKLNYWTDIHKYSFIHVRTSFIAMKITVFLKSNHPWERSVYIAADNDNIISSCLPSHTEDRGYWGWLEDGRWRWRWSCFDITLPCRHFTWRPRISLITILWRKFLRVSWVDISILCTGTRPIAQTDIFRGEQYKSYLQNFSNGKLNYLDNPKMIFCRLKRLERTEK